MEAKKATEAVLKSVREAGKATMLKSLRKAGKANAEAVKNIQKAQTSAAALVDTPKKLWRDHILCDAWWWSTRPAKSEGAQPPRGVQTRGGLPVLPCRPPEPPVQLWLMRDHSVGGA